MEGNDKLIIDSRTTARQGKTKPWAGVVSFTCASSASGGSARLTRPSEQVVDLLNVRGTYTVESEER